MIDSVYVIMKTVNELQNHLPILFGKKNSDVWAEIASTPIDSACAACNYIKY